MTIFNVIAGARPGGGHGIAAAADTASGAQLEGGRVARTGAVSKLLPLPHIPAVVVGQGPAATLMAGFEAAWNVASPELADVGPAIADDLRQTDREWRDRYGDLSELGPTDTTITVAGWSQTRGEPLVYVYSSDHGWGERFSTGAIGTGLTEVEAGSVSIASRQQALDLLLRQWRRLTPQQRASGLFGGAATVAEITGPSEIRTRKCRAFDLASVGGGGLMGAVMQASQVAGQELR